MGSQIILSFGFFDQFEKDRLTVLKSSRNKDSFNVIVIRLIWTKVITLSEVFKIVNSTFV